MMYDDVKLVMVTENNNNKFYNMHDNGNGTFTVTWGRVGTSGSQTTYGINEWQSKYNSKVKKGYQDISKTTTVTKGYKAESDPEIENLLTHLLAISRQYVSNQTDIGTLNASAIAEVQDLINTLTSVKSEYAGADSYKEWIKSRGIADTPQAKEKFIKECADKFNRALLKIWTIIPRKIKNVRDAVYNPGIQLPNSGDLDKYISNEQSLLDNIILQSKATNNANGVNTISEAFGFSFVKASAEETEFIKDKIAKESDSGSFRVKNVFKVANPVRDAEFEDYLQNNGLKNNKTNVKLYWHGTGPENVLSIMSNGLIIRPANAAYCGSAFGDGIYSAPSPNKSYNYTRQDSARSSRWMFVNAVITGKSFDCTNNYDRIGNIRICDLTGNSFSQLNLGYHSVHAHANSASYIRRDEVIVYNKAQVACRYLVEIA